MCSLEVLSYMFVEVLQYLAWALVGGLIAVGACWYGGYGAYLAWQKAGPPIRRQHADARIAHDAARGIAEIEAILAAYTTRPPAYPGEDPERESAAEQSRPDTENGDS